MGFWRNVAATPHRRLRRKLRRLAKNISGRYLILAVRNARSRRAIYLVRQRSRCRNDDGQLSSNSMSVTRDNIAGFMLGVSVGVGVGFLLKPFEQIDSAAD
jgi:hypothetical protein